MPPDRVTTARHDVDALVDRLHGEVIEEPDLADPASLRERLRALAPLLPGHATAQVLARVADRVQGLGPIAPLLGDGATTDVLVNGPGRVWIERGGHLVETAVEMTESEIRRLIDRLTAPSGRRVDLRRPLADLRLADGSRAHVVLPPVAVDGPYITIRRFTSAGSDIGDFASTEVAELLGDAVANRANLLVSGGTGSGKTTFLNALCAHLDLASRTVTVEDAAELRLPGRHVVRLETRPSSPEGLDATSVADLVRASLRMRPDRIIVGEVRGAECLDMLWAMNTGHEGSMTTCHANSPLDALRRIEAMALSADQGLDAHAVRTRIHAAIDLVVQVRRCRDGRRVVDTVAEPATDPDARPPLMTLTEGPRVLGSPTRPTRRPPDRSP